MRFVELFAGAGGAHLGLLRAGHEVVRAVEWNADAAATLRATGAEVYCGDVRHSDAYLGLPPVDALWASPPCQDWSSAGKRAGANGDRNGWPWTLDVIDFLRATGRGPAWAIFENVMGLTHHTGGCRCPHGPVESCAAGYFSRWILPELCKRFAHVTYEILDAASYGVPQRRHRVFIVCGPEEYRWPKPTHADPDLALSPIGKMMGLQPWRTVREALSLSLSLVGQRTPETARGGNVWRDPDEPAPTVPACATGMSARMWPRTEMTGTSSSDEPAPTVGGKANTYLHAKDQGTRGGSRPELLDRPSPCVSAVGECKGSGEGGNPEKMQRASDALCLGTGRRRLTVAECAALQSFPPDHPWQGTQTSQYAQVGNAVPPPLAEALARMLPTDDAR